MDITTLAPGCEGGDVHGFLLHPARDSIAAVRLGTTLPESPRPV